MQPRPREPAAPSTQQTSHTTRVSDPPVPCCQHRSPGYRLHCTGEHAGQPRSLLLSARHQSLSALDRRPELTVAAALRSGRFTSTMLISKKNRLAILSYLFKEGVVCAKKDYNLPKHPEIEASNLEVIKLMTSLTSRDLVSSRFSWNYYYWFLTDEGIE